MSLQKPRLSPEQYKVLRLIQRSPDKGDGWRSCSVAVFDGLIQHMSGRLVECRQVDDEIQVRLTDEAKDALV